MAYKLAKMNSTDNQWKLVKDFIQNEALQKNREELIEIIDWAWKDLSQETLEILIVSMPFSMMAIISAYSDNTWWQIVYHKRIYYCMILQFCKTKTFYVIKVDSTTKFLMHFTLLI